jgi:hypothetical protein
MEPRYIMLFLLIVSVACVALTSGCTNPFDTCESRNEKCKADCESRDNLLQVAACKLDCEAQYAQCHDQGF